MVEVRVPATSANMGAGFDCLGIALSLYNYFYVEEYDGTLDIQGCDEAHKNENNLVYTSIQRCFEKIGYKAKNKGLRIKIKSDIPSSRGLGSSAACIVGGIMCANEIAGSRLSINELVKLASEIEGHPDNTTPALLGGMTVAISHGARIYYEKVNIPSDLKFCSISPDFTLPTKKARSILPEQIPFKDAVFNVSRASLLVAAMASGNHELIKIACEDRLHQPYRAAHIPDYNEVIKEALGLNCLGAFLSGAGPTILVILKKEDRYFTENLSCFLSKLENKWDIRELEPDFEGAQIINKG